MPTIERIKVRVSRSIQTAQYHQAGFEVEYEAALDAGEDADAAVQALVDKGARAIVAAKRRHLAKGATPATTTERFMGKPIADGPVPIATAKAS